MWGYTFYVYVQIKYVVIGNMRHHLWNETFILSLYDLLSKLDHYHSLNFVRFTLQWKFWGFASLQYVEGKGKYNTKKKKKSNCLIENMRFIYVGQDTKHAYVNDFVL